MFSLGIPFWENGRSLVLYENCTVYIPVWKWGWFRLIKTESCLRKWTITWLLDVKVTHLNLRCWPRRAVHFSASKVMYLSTWSIMQTTQYYWSDNKTHWVQQKAFNAPLLAWFSRTEVLSVSYISSKYRLGGLVVKCSFYLHCAAGSNTANLW